MVVFDATTLLYFLDSEAKAPTDPETGETVTCVKERIAFLVCGLEGAKLSDFLSLTGHAACPLIHAQSRAAESPPSWTRPNISVRFPSRKFRALSDRRAPNQASHPLQELNRPC